MSDRPPLPPYFAYGSNLEPDQMARRCPGHVVLGPARLAHHALRFQGHGRDWAGAVATVVPSPGGTVWGVLFGLTPDHYASLDRYEGYDGPGDPRNLYDRVETVVADAEGREVPALTYVMRPFAAGAPSARYRDAILKGMRHHGLPAAAIAALEAVAVAGPGAP